MGTSRLSTGAGACAGAREIDGIEAFAAVGAITVRWDEPTFFIDFPGEFALCHRRMGLSVVSVIPAPVRQIVG